LPNILKQHIRMKTTWGILRRRLLGLPAEEASFRRRGFRGAAGHMPARLEQVGATFVGGFNLALEEDTPEALACRLNSGELELRGFAFEGAAMGLALLDWLTPWRSNRISDFLRGAGGAHAYMVHVGVGWAWARLPFGFRRAQRKLDPLLGWLALDGWGFHEGFFHWPKYISGGEPPRRLEGYERRVFDQGFGRSLWFVNGGDVALTARTISDFAATRHGDLWSGLGLAATYAGGADEPTLAALRGAAGAHGPQLAQGAAFAAKARQRAGNATGYTSLATHTLCGLSAEDAARLTDAALENLPDDSDEPAYEIWRRRIQNQFAQARQRQAA
jgi:hypothetical protein